MTLKVTEIFYSIQGESVFAGRPCAFVRLSGCNLRCAYCDTQYAWDGGEDFSVAGVVQALETIGCRLVEITGGEPLHQQDTPELIRQLLDRGFQVLLETNGSFDIGMIDRRCVKIVDVKCPSSRESHKMDLDNLGRLAGMDQVKFVIADRRDFEYAQATLRSHPVAISGGQILFSTVAGSITPTQLAAWILDQRLDVRLQVQLHKLLWPETERGV
jgi:7-carboxy-7-deazaguanine synthase